MNEKPLISVCLIAYNHAEFISQAIDGILMQQVNFSWEFIIADDYSTDGTREIIEKYKDKFPDSIRLIFQDENKGGQLNFKNLVQSAKGKYIAYCEGDDYWTDKNKLQIQVDFLEANPDYSLVFHNAIRLSKSGERLYHQHPLFNTNFSMVDVISIKGNIMPSASLVFRNILSENFFHFLRNKAIGDWYIQIYLLRHGKAKYFEKSMSVYRIHTTGVWSSATRYKQNSIINVFYKDFCRFMSHEKSGKKSIEIARSYIKELNGMLVQGSIKNRDFINTIKYLFKGAIYRIWK